MPKKLREFPIYVAHKIWGQKLDDNGTTDSYLIIDELEDKKLDPYNLMDNISIYKRQVENWFLQPAKHFIKEEQYIFVVLMICLSYFEGIEKYRLGGNGGLGSRLLFVNSMKRIYGNRFNFSDLETLYSQARCGLFHVGMTDSKIVLSYTYENVIEFVDSTLIKINPKLLLEDIMVDFDNYLLQLTTDVTLQRNFEAMFDIK